MVKPHQAEAAMMLFSWAAWFGVPGVLSLIFKKPVSEIAGSLAVGAGWANPIGLHDDLLNLGDWVAGIGIGGGVILGIIGLFAVSFPDEKPHD